MGGTGGSRRGGAKGEFFFVLLVILAFIAAYRLRETGVYDPQPVPPRISNQDMLTLINTVAVIPDRDERLRRIDAVVAEYGADKTPHIDYGVTWILIARAEIENTEADKIAVYDAILRRHSSREGLPARTTALLDWVAVKRVALSGSGDVETLRKVAEDNAGSSRPDQRAARMFALNELAKAAADVESKMQYFDQAFAEYREGDWYDGVLEHAADALGGKAELAKGEERKALLRELVDRFQSSPGRYAREKALWAGFHLALEAEAAERLGLLEELVGIYKNDTTEYAHTELGRAVGRILSLSRKSPDRGEILDRLSASLRGSASKDLAVYILTEKAGMLSGDAEKAEAYRAVINEFKNTDDASARGQVVSAARNLLKVSADKTAAAQICWDLASRYEGTDRTFTRNVSGMLADVADTVSGDADKLTAWDRFLEYAKHNPNPVDMVSLVKAFDEKSRLENAPDAAKRFFAEWVEGAGSDDEIFNALRMKLSHYNDRELVKEARGEIIAKFADTRDAERALLVVKALGTRDFPWLSVFGSDASEEEIRLYNSIADRFVGAEDEAGRTVYMSALLGEANHVQTTAEKAALCDRILAASVPAGSRPLERIRESAAKLKSEALDAPEILARYYAEQAAAKGETAQLLLSQAKAEPSRAKKEALFDQLIATYRNSTKYVRPVVAAFNGRAELAPNKEEARRRFREAVDYVAGQKNAAEHGPSLLSDTYERLIELASDRTEKLTLYDEQIQFSLKGDRKFWPARAMMEKAELVDEPEKIALYDRIIALLSGSDGTEKHVLMDALLAKAGAVEDDKEKSALYDKVIEAVGAEPEDYSSRSNLADAVAGRAKLPGGAQFFENYLGKVLQRDTDLVDNAKLATVLVEKIEEKELRDAGYEKILRRYSGESSSEMVRALDNVRSSRARSSGDFDEIRRLMAERSPDEEGEREAMRKRIEAARKAREARREEFNRRLAAEPAEAGKLALLDESIDRAAALDEANEIVRLLFLKADTVADADAKARTYDEILDWSIGWRSESYSKSWWDAKKAVEARASLIGDSAELAKYYDSLIEQYKDAERMGGDFLASLHLGRITLIADRAERKAALERALGELGKRGVSKYALEPLYRALIDLNVEDRLSGGE